MNELHQLKDEFNIFKRKFENIVKESEGTKNSNGGNVLTIVSKPYTFNQQTEDLLGMIAINWEEPIITFPINNDAFVVIRQDSLDCDKVIKCILDNYDDCSNWLENSEKLTCDTSVVYVNSDSNIDENFYMFTPLENYQYKSSRLELTFDYDNMRITFEEIY